MFDLLLKTVLLSFLAALIWVIGLCALSVTTGVAILVRKAYESDRSMWYYAGCASVYLRLLVRSPSIGIAAIVAALVTIQFVDSIESLVEEAVASSRPTGSNPPPVIAPVLEDTLRMPTAYPFERTRTSWPPFIGHTFPLGRRSS